MSLLFRKKFIKGKCHCISLLSKILLCSSTPTRQTPLHNIPGPQVCLLPRSAVSPAQTVLSSYAVKSLSFSPVSSSLSTFKFQDSPGNFEIYQFCLVRNTKLEAPGGFLILSSGLRRALFEMYKDKHLVVMWV